MNIERRKAITEIHQKLEEIMSCLDNLRDEEQEAYDNMPEPFQDSERGEAMYEAIYNLEYAYNSIEEANGYLEEHVE